MTPDQLRSALKELNGERDVMFAFSGLPEHESHLLVPRAMLIPDEPDHLIKVTDGKHIYVIENDLIAYIRITLSKL